MKSKVSMPTIRCPNCNSTYIQLDYSYDFRRPLEEEYKCFNCRTMFSIRYTLGDDDNLFSIGYDVLAKIKF